MKRTITAIILASAIFAMAGCNSQTTTSGQQSSQTSSLQSPFSTSLPESSQPQSQPESSQPQSSAESESPTKLYALPDSCKIEINGKKALTINTDSGAVPASDLVFVCDDDSVALVDSSGNVVGRSEGNCVVTASLKNKPASFVKINVTVKPAAESSVVQPSIVEPSKPEETSTVTPQIIVIQPSQNYETSVSIPQNYTYTFGQDNFSYSRLSDGYVAYAMTDRWLTNSDVSKMSKNDAQILINTIYAKYGYHFSDTFPEVRDFFKSMAWYSDKGYSDTQAKKLFNETDEHNMELLLPLRG